MTLPQRGSDVSKYFEDLSARVQSMKDKNEWPGKYQAEQTMLKKEAMKPALGVVIGAAGTFLTSKSIKWWVASSRTSSNNFVGTKQNHHPYEPGRHQGQVE